MQLLFFVAIMVMGFVSSSADFTEDHDHQRKMDVVSAEISKAHERQQKRKDDHHRNVQSKMDHVQSIHEQMYNNKEEKKKIVFDPPRERIKTDSTAKSQLKAAVSYSTIILTIFFLYDSMLFFRSVSSMR